MKKILVMTLALVSYASFAADAKPAKKEPMIDKVNNNVSGQGYGTAGCGLGSIVFGEKPGMTQIFAATTNGTFGTQTFGISSGTSNCVDSSSHAQNLLPNFVETNKVALASDISRGSGETINHLAAVLGCSKEDALGKNLQKNYKVLFPSENINADQLSNSIKSVIKQDQKLANTCSHLS